MNSYYPVLKILSVITSLRVGGAERLLVDMLPRLVEMGYQADVYSFNNEDTPFAEKLTDAGLKICRHSAGGTYNVMHIIELAKIMGQYDVVHSHNTSSQFFVAAAARLLRKPPLLVTTEHNTWNRRRAIPLAKYIDRWMYDTYDGIVGCSEKVRINLLKHIGGKRNISTITNGINLSRLIRANSENIQSGRDVIMTMVAGFRAQKDQPTIVRALCLLPENYIIQFVGTGAREQEIRNLAEKLGVESRCRFLGIRTDIPDILAKSDIFVFASHYEGMPLALVEAMGAGLPIVASDVDGICQLLKGDTGILFPDSNESLLAKAILNLTQSPELMKRYSEASVKKAAEYDIEKTAVSYIELYKKLMK